MPQMCGKQCRDENGFKCHLSSEGHKRQMEIFGQNPKRIIEGCVPPLLLHSVLPGLTVLVVMTHSRVLSFQQRHAAK
jgi:hypothetical protein